MFSLNTVQKKLEKNHITFSLPRAPQAFARFLYRYYKNKKILLYGGGKHSEEVLTEYPSEQIHNILALVDDDANCLFNTCVPIVKTEHITKIEFDFIVISNSLYFQAMVDKLLSLGVPSNKIVNIYRDERFLNDYQQENNVISIEQVNDKKNIVLIVPMENADHITRASCYLKNDFNLYKLYYFMHDAQDTNEYFSQVDQMKNSLYLLDFFLKNNVQKIDLIVINLIPSIYHVVYYIKTLYPSIKVIASFLDVLSFFGNKKRILQALEFKDRYNFERYCQKFLIQKCDGLIVACDGKYIYQEVFRHSNKYLQYFNYFPEKINYFQKTTLSEKIMCIYAGGVLPSSSKKIISADIKMANIFEKLLKQNIKVDAYFSNVDAFTLKSSEYQDYSKLRQNYDFTYNNFLPTNELLKKMQYYHFGLMIYDFTIAKKAKILRKHLYSAIPTKIFTYLAAGIPILISEEIYSAKEFLVSHGVAISVRSSDFNNIEQLIGQYDYAQMKENVAQFQKKFCLENHYNVLKNFLFDVINAEGKDK